MGLDEEDLDSLAGIGRWTEDPDISKKRYGFTETYGYGSKGFMDYLESIPPRDADIESLWDEETGVLGAHPYPSVFYHITPTRRLKTILKEGLKVGKIRSFGSKDLTPRYGIYLAEDLKDLIGDMFTSSSPRAEFRTQNFTVLKVKVPKGVPIGEDPEFSEEAGFGYWIVFGDIPPENLEVIRRFSI